CTRDYLPLLPAASFPTRKSDAAGRAQPDGGVRDMPQVLLRLHFEAKVDGVRSRYCSIERSRRGHGGEQCPCDIIGVFNFDQTDVLCSPKFVMVEVYFHSLSSSGLVVSRVSFPSATSSQIQMSRGDVAMDSPIVLCIDDRPQALEFRKAILECRGYCVKTASSGSTAMKMLEETSASAVLLEYKHEGMDAEAVACHIKRRFPSLPIILLSAYSGCQSEFC